MNMVSLTQVTDYMIDIECLGVNKDCVIVSVGVVAFNLQKGVILDQKYWELNLRQQQKAGRTISADTVQWWSAQSSNTLKALQNKSRTNIEDFIKEFNSFIEQKGYYWAKGTNYDLEILANLYNQYGHLSPFKYSKWSDARPFYRLAKDFKLEPPEDRSLAHNALDDAVYQAKVVCNVYRFINEKKKV